MIHKKGQHKSQCLILATAILCLISGCDGKPKNKKKKDITVEQTTVTLRIHAWEGYVEEYEKTFVEKMKKEHRVNVKIELTHASGLDSFLSYAKNQNVHLISPAADLLAPLKKAGVLQPVDFDKIQNSAQLNPIILQKNLYKIEGVPYALPFNFGPYAIAWNKNKMQQPTSYAELWNPKYRKRVTISGFYDTINIYMTALMLGYPKEDLFNLSDAQLNAVEKKLSELCRLQIVDYWRENLNPKKRDLFDIGMDWGIGVKQINEQYKGNWEFTIPREGATGWIDTWALTVNVTDSLTKMVAYEFMNFMISSRIQARVAQNTSYAPVNPFAGRYLSADEKKKYYLTDPQFIEKIVLWQPLDKEVLKKYQATWQRVRNNSTISATASSGS
ncbi:MAG: extracellular solute-binding protein [Deltaproteobacteria bacterium]|nr:extracellular solute-binding protein [Deltaproteobacteria bacterium]